MEISNDQAVRFWLPVKKYRLCDDVKLKRMIDSFLIL